MSSMKVLYTKAKIRRMGNSLMRSLQHEGYIVSTETRDVGPYTAKTVGELTDLINDLVNVGASNITISTVWKGK